MNAKSRPADVSPSEINSEAAAWIALLHAEERTPKMDAELRRWLQADPRHRAAFEHANEVWQATSTLPESISSRYPPWQAHQLSRRTWQLRVAVAAVLVIALGTALFYGLRRGGIETEIGELRTITLADGTRVTLNTATRLTVKYEERLRRVDLKAGEAIFNVAKNPQRPFVVRAGDREVTALGTSFVVRLDANRTAVTLVEGKVSVAPVSAEGPAPEEALAPIRPAAILHPGERLTIAAHHRMQLDRPAMEALTAWQRGQVVFDRTPLADAIEEMNRYSERKVVVEGPRVPDFRVSGIFNAGDQESFALAIRDTYGLPMRPEARRIVLATGVQEVAEIAK